MTQEEKQILIKDLCARLPYGVICKLSDKGADVSITEKLNLGGLEHFMFGTMDVKPYLRPMSSMTKKEKNRYDILVEEIVYRPGVLTCSSLINFCHKHHLDNLGLIEKGLALEAPEGMYKTE